MSTSEQDAEAQLRSVRLVAEQRGWTVAGEYVDRGVSGAQQQRPELDRLMADVRTGAINRVVVFRFDRFPRSTRNLLAALDEFRTLGVEFVSLHEGIDTSTPLGRMIFTVVAAMAELEREIIRERVIAGIANAQAHGTHCGRPRRHLDLRSVDALVDQRHSLRQVARILGVPRSTIQRRLREREQGGPKPSHARDGDSWGAEMAQKPAQNGGQPPTPSGPGGGS